MSFGSYFGAIKFEPFLLLPVAFAMLVLVVELARKLHRPLVVYSAMGTAPAMLLCGLTGNGMTELPIHSDLHYLFGSAITVSLLMALLFFVYTLICRVPGSQYAVLTTLLAISCFAAMPGALEMLGVRRWMTIVPADLVLLAIALRLRNDWHALALMALIAVTIVQAGMAYDYRTEGLLVAVAFMLASMMVIGVLFKTPLADALRKTSAAAMLVAGGAIVGWHYLQHSSAGTVAALAMLVVTSFGYTVIVKRTGWVYVGGVQSVLMGLLWVNLSGWNAAAVDGAGLPIQSGLACLAIGLTITTFKTGVCRRVGRHQAWSQTFAVYRSGF